MRKDSTTELLEENFILNVDMLESIRRGTGKVIYSTERGVLIYDTLGEVYMMYTIDYKGRKEILDIIPNTVEALVVHSELDCISAKKKFKFMDKIICNNVVYRNTKKIEIPEGEVKVRLLTEEYSDLITKIYPKEYARNKDYIKERIKSGELFGAFIGDKLCGFIGTHI